MLTKGVFKKKRKLRISVWDGHATFSIIQTMGNLPKSKETFVGVDALVEPLTSSNSLADSFRPGQIHKIELGSKTFSVNVVGLN